MIFKNGQSGENINSSKGAFVIPSTKNNPVKDDVMFIRFEEKKEKIVWAHPNEIYFVVSADHYVKSLIKCGDQTKWMIRHSTIKDLLDILPVGNFVRLNRFYLLNTDHFLHIDENEKLLYFTDSSSIAIPHRISPFLCHLLKSTHT